MVMRSVQGALSGYTNPQVAIVSATFDTLDKNAEEYAVMGKELFMPTMEALRGNTDEQPVVLLMENGQKIVKDAKVFLSVAKMLKKVDFIFEIAGQQKPKPETVSILVADAPFSQAPAQGAQGNAG